jgi:Adenylate and Guanylate cyclase catalytic domain
MSCLPTGTVSFLLTDIDESTRLLQEQGDRYGQALAEHRRRLRTAFVRHAGIEVDTQGDAFFYVFRSAMEAVAAAEEGQASLSCGPIRVRIGIHTCEPKATSVSACIVRIVSARLLMEVRFSSPSAHSPSWRALPPSTTSACTGARTSGGLRSSSSSGPEASRRFALSTPRTCPHRRRLHSAEDSSWATYRFSSVSTDSSR